jgi:two-component system alkaline phosphatase synthesis response regulator PhoP
MIKILIAEDEPDIRELVKLTLQFAGFEVIATANGAELVERAPEVMPDLILTDVRMPRMTGYEACRALKEMPKMAGIPIVFLSAKGQEDEVKAGLAAGGEAYILKPFAPDLLVRHVKELLELRQQGAKVQPSGATDHIQQQRSSTFDPKTGETHFAPHPATSHQMPSGDGVTRVTKPLNPAVIESKEDD